jgi:hypothetical protein
VIFDQLDYGSYYDLSTDGTVYQGRPDRRLFLHRLRNGHGDPGDRRLRTAYLQSGGDFVGASGRGSVGEGSADQRSGCPRDWKP